MKRHFGRHLLLAIGMGLGSHQCMCQHPCQIDYGNENQIDYNLRPRVGVSGSITLPNSSPVPNVCVAVFTDDTHQFVLGRTSDAKGRFDLALVPNKTYRLVVRVSPFGVANARLRIIPEDRADQPLHIHIKPRGLDTTSYIDTDQAIPTHH